MGQGVWVCGCLRFGWVKGIGRPPRSGSTNSNRKVASAAVAATVAVAAIVLATQSKKRGTADGKGQRKDGAPLITEDRKVQ